MRERRTFHMRTSLTRCWGENVFIWDAYIHTLMRGMWQSSADKMHNNSLCTQVDQLGQLHARSRSRNKRPKHHSVLPFRRCSAPPQQTPVLLLLRPLSYVVHRAQAYLTIARNLGIQFVPLLFCHCPSIDKFVDRIWGSGCVLLAQVPISTSFILTRDSNTE